ncbi:hypothetical protein FHG87_025308 [Trinorchestia longiramus]|nr:hypothetical protein FHG87_025308 [Trinorchestia longiramus]
MKLENGQKLQDHLKVFVELFEELAIIGDAIVEEERVIILLSSLPDRFSTLVTALEAHEKIPAWEVVTERLLNEERRQRGSLGNVDCDSWIVDSGATQHMCNKKNQFSSYSDLSSPVRVEIGDGRALKGVGVGDVRLKITLPNMQKDCVRVRNPAMNTSCFSFHAVSSHLSVRPQLPAHGSLHTSQDRRMELTIILTLRMLYDFNAKRILLSRDVVFNESQFMSFEKEPSKEIECVPRSFPQEEKHEDSGGELELRRSTRNRAAPDRFGEWVCFAQDKFDVAFCTKEIDLVYCPSNDMLTDTFTKGLSAEKFSRLRRKLGVVFFEKHIQCEKEC